MQSDIWLDWQGEIKNKTRAKEHEACFKNNNISFLLAKHVLEHNHNNNFKPVLLHVEKKDPELVA